MFCVKCGREMDSDGVNGLCMECYLGGRTMMRLPHHTDLERCTNCGEYRFGDRWVAMGLEDAVEETALSSMQIALDGKVEAAGAMSEAQDERTYKVTVEADISVNGCMVTETADTLIRLKNTVCRKCSRQLGNYYEATLQIRSGEKDLSDGLRDEVVRRVRDSVEIQSRTNRQLFITSVKQVPGGVDILLSNISLGKGLAKELADAYGAETKESASLVGMSSDGIDIYRLTYLVRMPAYHVGDILEWNGAPCKLQSVGRSGGKVVSLTDFRESSVRRSDLKDMRIVSKCDDLREAVVLSRSDGEVQVMHPSTYASTDLRVPKGAEIGDTVVTVQDDDVLYFVP